MVVDRDLPGAPPVSTILPLFCSSLIRSLVTDPAATATSGRSRTFVKIDSGKDGNSTPFPFVLRKAALPLITTSAFLYDCVKIVSKPLLIVSVRT